MNADPIRRIVICGGGFAAWMTAAALSKALPENIVTTVLETPDSNEADTFYGTVTCPKAYNFHLSLGLSEADLLLQTQTAFSYGTHYENWGLTGASWTQCFHNPLPNWEGIPFTDYITAGQKNLEDYLVSARAASAGKFAHPPQDKRIPLSLSEYGYQFSPRELTTLLKVIAMRHGAKCITGDVKSVNVSERHIQSINLNDEGSLTADLFVDCSGPEIRLLSNLDKSEFKPLRYLGIFYSESKSVQLGSPVRQLTSGLYGWQSLTPLLSHDVKMTVFDPNSEDEALQAHNIKEATQLKISTGQLPYAWIGNCVGIGHAAAVLEPISPAPIMLLQMDIERLLGLIPVTNDMETERQIYNNSFQSDLENAQLFNDAFFQLEDLPDTVYWNEARGEKISPKLERKLTQFNHRGFLVSYDLEPFNEEDWAILHYGMGRRPQKKNPFAVLSPGSRIDQQLETMARSIQDIVPKMPPHHVYMTKFLNYLERNHVSDF